MISLNLHNILLEGKRDEALAAYLPYFEKRGISISISQLKQALLEKFVNEAHINNLSMDSNYYLCGVARYYFSNDLTTNPRIGILYGTKDKFKREECKRLNELILILRNKYIDSVGTSWEQPEDFGTLSLQALLKKYNSVINKSLGIGKEEEVEEKPSKKKSSVSAGKNYTYEIMYDYESCRKFFEATAPGSWCITYGQQHYNSYIRAFKRFGGIHYVVFKKKGYENVPRKCGKNFTKQKPQDEYGNSLICVLQRNDCPEPTYITSRWNHGSTQDGTYGTEADHAYTKEEFLKVIGCREEVLQRCYDQWKEQSGIIAKKNNDSVKKRLEALRGFKYAQMMLNGGARVEDLFKSVHDVCHDSTDPRIRKMKFAVRDIDGKDYTTLICGRKILYENFLVPDDYRINTHVNFSTMIIEAKQGSRARYYFYDLRRQQMMTFGTEKYVSYVGDTYFLDNLRKYIIIGKTLTTQALVDLEKCNVIKTPSSDIWCEEIRPLNAYSYRRKDTLCSLKNVSKNNDILEMVYDEAMGKIFYFSQSRKMFIDIPNTLENPMSENGEILKCGNGRGKLRDFFSNKWVWYHSEDGETKKLYNVLDREFFVINGCDTFREIECEKEVLAYEPAKSGKVLFWNILLNKQIDFVGNGNNKYGWLGLNNYNGIYILESNCQRENNYSKIYLPAIDKFYSDDISGDKFNYYGGGKVYVSGEHNLPVPHALTVLSGTKKGKIATVYYLPLASEMTRKIEEMMESYRNRFNLMLEKLLRKQ